MCAVQASPEAPAISHPAHGTRTPAYSDRDFAAGLGAMLKARTLVRLSLALAAAGSGSTCGTCLPEKAEASMESAGAPSPAAATKHIRSPAVRRGGRPPTDSLDTIPQHLGIRRPAKPSKHRASLQHTDTDDPWRRSGLRSIIAVVYIVDTAAGHTHVVETL